MNLSELTKEQMDEYSANTPNCYYCGRQLTIEESLHTDECEDCFKRGEEYK